MFTDFTDMYDTYSLTHSMEQNLSWDADRFSATPHFMEPESSLPHSYVLAICPYPETERSVWYRIKNSLAINPVNIPFLNTIYETVYIADSSLVFRLS